MSNNSKVYFATLEGKELGKALTTKVEHHDTSVISSELFSKRRKMERFIFGMTVHGHHSSDLTTTGENGELQALKINQLARLLEKQLSIVISSKPALQAVPANSDVKSLSQAILGTNILSHYERELHLERLWKEACKYALSYGDGFIMALWNATKGEVVKEVPELDENDQPIIAEDANNQPILDAQGQPVYVMRKIRAGDLDVTAHSPFDVIMDSEARTLDMRWVIVRSYVSKFDLAAKFPLYETKILGLSANTTQDSFGGRAVDSMLYDTASDREIIPVYDFFHLSSDAVPEGKHVRFIQTGDVLTETPLVVKKIPVLRISPKHLPETAYGWTAAFDLLGPQETLDFAYSTLATNAVTFSGGVLLAAKQAKVDMNSLGGGTNLMEYDYTTGVPAPDVLTMPQTSKDVLEVIGRIEAKMVELAGLNSVVLGNPEGALRGASGAAMAALSSMATQFINDTQSAYKAMLEDTGTLILDYLKLFAQDSRTIKTIAGQTQGYMTESFKAEDLEGVGLAKAEVVNPVSQTLAAKIAIADSMFDKGLIKSQDEYILAISSASTPMSVQASQNKALLVKKENERLMRGIKPRAFISDDHAFHIQSHLALADDPEMRENDELMEMILDHVMEHKDMMVNADPDLMAIMGYKPLPSGMSPPNPSQAQMTDPNSADPNMPSMPNNPLTGEDFSPQDGSINKPLPQ